MAAKPLVFHADMGLQDTLGYVTYVYAGHTEIHLDVRKGHLNRAGYLHGGVVSVLLDSACGYAASRHLSADVSERVVTLSMTTNYLAPSREGDIRAISRVTGGGARTIFTEGRVVDSDDNVLATCSAVMRRLAGGLAGSDAAAPPDPVRRSSKG